MKQQPFFISRIRLINFHNFVDETITIPDRGHLFLLGDNGCGKTTVLDAVHYVLTAGRFMEWNSAARVVKRRNDGRRLQGVILRYNMETGVMNPEGSISYAAVEICGRHGRSLTIGLGMSVQGMDEQVRPWGVIRECPLEEIPFIIEDEHGRRPASRREFKQGLGSSRGFYPDSASYRRELAARLFGGSDSYTEICRFLKMGKAYREIAAGAADYHELFKQLLPEPHTAIFEQIIEGLRSLDESRTLLDDLERKVDYVRSLQASVIGIDRFREAVCRYDWLLCHWNLKKNSREREENRDRLTRLELEQQKAVSALAGLEKEERLVQERLADLKAKDSSGWVRQEKSCTAEWKEKKEKLVLAAARLREKKTELRRAEQAEKQEQKELVNRLGKLVSECGRRARQLPFSIADLQQKADQLYRRPDAEQCLHLTGDAVFARVEEHGRDLNEQVILLRQKVDQAADRVKGLAADLENRRRQKTPQPGRDLVPCIQSLANAMLTVRPLYLGLEWSPGLSAAEQARIEETIGEEILATLLAADADYPACREAITDWPGIRISCKSRTGETLPDWIRSAFDIGNSDPTALRCLAGEMEAGSGQEPRVSQQNKEDLLAFRSHQRTLTGTPARLIGAESRQRALAAEIAQLEQEHNAAVTEQQKQEKKLNALVRKMESMQQFGSRLTELLRMIRGQARLLNTAQQEQGHSRDRYEQQQEIHDEQQQEVQSLALRRDELKALIAQQGLKGLEQRIASLENKGKRLQERIGRANQELGSIRHGIAQKKTQEEILTGRKKELRQQQEEFTAVLATRLPEVTDISYYVLKTKTGQQFTSSEAIAARQREAEREAMALVVDLKHRINDPRFGAAFRFYYEEADNELRDSRARLLADILPEQEQAVREQQELINDHTRELFTRIIMTDLMNYLRGHVSSLEQMMRNINRLLKERSFGGQQYCFRVRPLDRFKQLVKVVKKFSAFDPGADSEVRHFFEDHQEEIMAAEVGAIPDELDYRNWYRYELEVSAIGSQDGEKGVVMDRTTKSIGSGGEQAVPNYLLILTIAHFLYQGKKVRLHSLLFDEAFYGIDAGRRDQLLGFATDLGLQLFVASPDQDGVRREISHSTTLFVVKDIDYNVHLRDFHWQNPDNIRQPGLFDEPEAEENIAFGEEL
jgi:hypothetical protein